MSFWLDVACAVDTPVEVDIFGDAMGGRVAKALLYDPTAARVRS